MVQINVNFTNNPQGVYYSGQALSGEIEINNEKSRSIRNVSMEIQGFAEVMRIELFQVSLHNKLILKILV